MSWNEERIELLRQLWDKGISASQIAEQLGGGITRNAVIGKAHRLNLKSRPSPVKPDAAKKAAAAVAKAAAQASSSAEAKPAAAPAPAQTTGTKASKAQASQKTSASAQPAVSAQPAAPAQIVAEPPQDAAASQAVAHNQTVVAAKANKLAQVEAPFTTSLPPALDAMTMPATQPVPSQKRTKAAAPKPSLVTLLDLTDKICKWPIGHPSDEDFHFCGKPVNPGTPYCVEHCAVAYQAQLPRRDKQRPGALPAPKFRV